ncbi:phosphoglycolate phosphatase [Microbacteriaceae bacterium SG_E_30_P1]|uniref:Phosphoglycolate phosphatase n=1 Tax=Antiquaquibacter oligotrophicus TaxID=2880260 RepID=A0ABT6KQN8_9MICO|nr:HAD hydrolase-like protein [Antiquaquibacter oligotrophicus]MDH6182302.1 phosphoglycolate phosphatase [Antiquaquibacter oligotrophicus]UDF12043.1 HAD hydrolase-like protein [Antiquaquibacter oligotrophicus]
MTSPYTCILFDLDGTIADSAPGITASLGYVFEKLGLPVPSQPELREWVGPPLLDAFRDRAGMTPEESAVALAIYREHYISRGTKSSPIFDGIPAVLHAIHDAGVPLALATSKPEFPASVILDHGNLTQLFRVLSGASIDEIRSAKKDVIAEAITRFRMVGVDVSRPIMVGDRDYDVEGAAVHGIPTIFVEWGYGSSAESEGAIATVASPSELIPLLLG